jgi:hypothetical protein
VTALLDHATRSAGTAAGRTPLTAGAAVIVMALVLALLIEREIARPLLSPAHAARLRGLTFLVAPLVLIVLVVLASRFEELLP